MAMRDPFRWCDNFGDAGTIGEIFYVHKDGTSHSCYQSMYSFPADFGRMFAQFIKTLDEDGMNEMAERMDQIQVE
jgi:hypothetical protein